MLIKGEFLKHLFCNSISTALCYEKNDYLLFSFMFTLLITMVPNLKKFQYISTVAAISIISLGILNFSRYHILEMKQMFWPVVWCFQFCFLFSNNR